MSVNPNDITAYRRKKKKKTLLYKFAAIFLICGGAVLVWLNASVIFEPLRGIGSRIGTKTTDETGFPVKLPGSATYSLSSFGSNFSLLTDTYLYTYTTAGAQIYALQHGYSNPVQKTSERRILIYNHSGHEFSLYNRTSSLYEKKIDEKIVSAVLGGNDMVAITATSSLYSNVVYVYNDSGEWKYTKKFGDERVNSIAFSRISNEMYLASSNVVGGDISSYVYRLKYDTKDDEIWKYTLPANSWALGVYESADGIIILCDNMVISLNYDGTLNGTYAFNTGTLQIPVISLDFSILLLSDYVTGKTFMVSLDNKTASIAKIELPFSVKKVEISGNMVYTLEGDEINVYDRFLEHQNTVSLAEEYQDFIKINNEIFLLGYETVVAESLG